MLNSSFVKKIKAADFKNFSPDLCYNSVEMKITSFLQRYFRRFVPDYLSLKRYKPLQCTFQQFLNTNILLYCELCANNLSNQNSTAYNIIGCFVCHPWAIYLRISARVSDEHVRKLFVDYKDIVILFQACIGRLIGKFKVKMEKFQRLLHRSFWPVCRQRKMKEENGKIATGDSPDRTNKSCTQQQQQQQQQNRKVKMKISKTIMEGNANIIKVKHW